VKASRRPTIYRFSAGRFLRKLTFSEPDEGPTESRFDGSKGCIELLADLAKGLTIEIRTYDHGLLEIW